METEPIPGRSPGTPWEVAIYEGAHSDIIQIFLIKTHKIKVTWKKKKNKQQLRSKNHTLTEIQTFLKHCMQQEGVR